MSTNNGNANVASTVISPSLTAYLNLSDYMYQAFDTSYSATPLKQDIGFAPLVRINGRPVVAINYATGLYAEAFLSTGAGTKQVIIAYEGTQLSGAVEQGLSFSKAEIQDDAQLFAGQKASSLAGAASFAQHVISFAGKLGVNAQNIYVTGHSLGAAEADYAASQTGLAGVTFAAPGISTAYTGVYPNVANAGKVVNYVDGGDPVGNYAADGADTLAPVLASNSIKHYGGVDVLPNAGGQNNLRDAASAYGHAKSLHSTALEDAALATAIAVNGHDHLLPQYAQDLGYLEGLGKPLPLYLADGSTNSASGFFPSAKSVTSYGSVDPSWIAAATTAGNLLHSQSPSISTGHASVLAAASNTLAETLGIKAHHFG